MSFIHLHDRFIIIPVTEILSTPQLFKLTENSFLCHKYNLALCLFLEGFVHPPGTIAVSHYCVRDIGNLPDLSKAILSPL